jgi:hypothetical protein
LRAPRAAGIAVAASLVLGAAARADEAAPTVQIVDVRPEGLALLVSFRVEGAFGADVVEQIDSGMAVTFEHRVDLLAKRPVPLVPAKLLSRTVVATTARYDTLTRQYYLERRTVRETPEAADDANAAVVTSATTERGEMEAWMTSVADAPIAAPPAEFQQRKLRVRVRTELGRRYRLLIFPFTIDAEAERLLRP